ncbi:hypothetical protein AB0J01_27880 [Streptomyces sp. NPDC050204]|uniref:hypothetical protein n=1 Tax=Streptomyces sp. NPDC050204 TaxID=3155514 RepID=UPI00343E821B
MLRNLTHGGIPNRYVAVPADVTSPLLRKLIPADPIWLRHFLAMEEDVLHPLSLYSEVMRPSPSPHSKDWATLAASAYDSWLRIWLELPEPLHRLTKEVSGQQPVSGKGGTSGYDLLGPDGARHTELYHADLREKDLETLTRLLHLVHARVNGSVRDELSDTLAAMAADLVSPADAAVASPASYVESFDQALRVLLLPAPLALLDVIPFDVSAGTTVILDAQQEEALLAFPTQVSVAVTH